jgi:predicted peptidase
MSHRSLVRLSLASLLLFSCSCLPAGEQTAHEFRGKAVLDVGYRYLLSLPDGYEADKGKKWPLIIFLHGAGERGTDLEVLKKHGPPKLVAAGKRFEAIIASLQCEPKQIWNSHGVKALADDLVKTHRVDADRIYLTGLSMGGFGTWDTALDYPDFFAAIVPICGGAGVRWVMADRIQHLPVWVFHGDKDPAVPVEFSIKMADALKKAGGNVKLTIYPGVGHDSWTQTYDDPALWEWLFSQKRQPSAK